MKLTQQKYSHYLASLKPMAKNHLVRTYGSIIFTLFSIIIFVFFAIKPTVETILVLEKKIDNAREVLAKLNKKSTDLTQAKDNYQKLDQSIKDKIEAALPNNIQIKSLTSILEEIAQKHSASISALQIQPLSFDLKPLDTIGTSAEINFTFNMETRYQDLLSILQEFKTSARVISIDRVSITKSSEGTNLILSLNGKGFFLK